MKLLSRFLYALPIAASAGVIFLVANFFLIPTQNTAATHFDTLIVLGCPTRSDGTPTPELRERVLEGVREYKAGTAPHVIFSGAAAHNTFVEAQAMAQLALAEGVPAAAVMEEPRARSTIENLVNSAQIMHQHGWDTAEIISSPSHLPRAAIIVNALNLQQPGLSFMWHTHAAQWPAEYSLQQKAKLYAQESLKDLSLRFNNIPAKQLAPRP